MFILVGNRQINIEVIKERILVPILQRGNNLKLFMQQGQNNYNQLLKNVKIFDESFLHNSKYTKVVMCSDGGSKDNMGSIGIVLQCDGKIILTLNSKVPKIYED
jgi:hypothetical protein